MEVAAARAPAATGEGGSGGGLMGKGWERGRPGVGSYIGQGREWKGKRRSASGKEIPRTTSRSFKDKFFEKVINPYLPEVMTHPQTIEMHEEVLHILDIQGPKKEVSEKAMLTKVEQEIFKCQGIVEHGLCANHSMIVDSFRKNKKEHNEIVEMIFKLHYQLQDLWAQSYGL
ncbi:40S ribosomal protein S5-1 [Hordeum vulgare]|nr:40S ribosomal protein S5-1 [Hordeum vulgare]